MKFDVLIFGTGSLATETCYSISALKNSSLKVCVLGRDIQKAKSIANICSARALCFNTSHEFYADSVIWTDDHLKLLIEKYEPKLIVVMSSLQSAWEFSSTAENEWQRLVKNAGYACTIPFQTYLVAKIARLTRIRSYPCEIINACYPDIVNALLKSMGCKVLCGVGNIGIIHNNLQLALSPNLYNSIKVLAHHYHLSNQTKEYPFMVWNNNVLINHAYKIPLIANDIKGKELNHLTGSIAASILTSFFGSDMCSHHVPGPLGLHGGFPVKVGKMQVVLDLPTSLPSIEAESLNIRWSELDGVTVLNDGFVKFSPKIENVLGAFNNFYKTGFFADELEKVLEYFILFRDELRKKN